MSVINFEFRNEVLKHNASLAYCYQCSTCSGGCPVALITNGKYNPRKIIEEAILGMQDKLVEKQEPNSWLCSTCQKCVELCPQKVELTEIFTLIKNLCFEAGKVPDAFIAQGRAVLDTGVAIPYSKAILTRREKLGLPAIKTAPVDEIKKILIETNFEKHIPKGVEENLSKAGIKEKVVIGETEQKVITEEVKKSPEAQTSLLDILYFYQPDLKKRRE